MSGLGTIEYAPSALEQRTVLVDAVGDDPEHLEDVGHAPAVVFRQLGVESCDLVPVVNDG